MCDNKFQVLPEGFCDGCCYDDNPCPELKCNKVKCCYLVHDECLVKNTYLLNE